MQLNSASSGLRPRATARASLRRRLSAECCETSCERLICVSFAVYRLLLNASRHLRLTCDASTFAECCEASLPHLPRSSRAFRTSEPSRSLISSTSVLDLKDFINGLRLGNLHDSCDFWKLLQHRVSSRTGHQRSLNGPSCKVFCTFASLAPVVASRQHSFLLRWFLPELWKDQTRSPRAIQ